MSEQRYHFAIRYTKQVNEILHAYLWPTWFYKHEIYEIPGIATAVLITYDKQRDDEFQVHTETELDEFLKRMARVAEGWVEFSRDTMKKFAQHPEKVIAGWEGRTIYFIKGGNNPDFWTASHAEKDTFPLLVNCAKLWGPMVLEEVKRAKELMPVGPNHFRDYEDHIRVVINFLFVQHLGEATPQKRTEPGNEGCEIRDLICQNRSELGFWKDLKDKYSCTEIVFEAKNTNNLTRDDLRQIYCYLKPALGLWGFIVCRETQPGNVQAYNRTLFKNFGQTRGVLILTDDDLRRMVEMRLRGHDPSDYIRDRMSDFTRSI